MPTGIGKVYSFLSPIVACRAVKEIVWARIGLVKKSNKIIPHCSFLIHAEAKLSIHSFSDETDLIGMKNVALT